MSDLHQLPLRGHDLPEIIEISPEVMRSLWCKARVYKSATFLGDPAWRWEHWCIGRTVPMGSYPFLDFAEALASAAKHARKCC